MPAATLGLKTQIESFIAAPDDVASGEALALVSADTGFMPEHPYHSGSGDHVNASHLADTARQFLRLTKAEAGLVILGGEMQFDRYVELNQPFQLTLSDVSADTSVLDTRIGSSSRVLIAQGEKRCATITLHASH